MEKPKRRIPRWLIVAGVIVALLAGAGLVAARVVPRLAARQNGAAALKTAQVTTITAVDSVESSGAVQALQSASVFWETTGTVVAVKAKEGDQVKAGDVLMTLDPTSAPANVILAQADLIAAQKTLDDLLHPSALALANAEKAVADAQDALEKAQKDLRNAQYPVGQGLLDAIADTQLALDTAQANLQLANVDPNVSAYNNAVFVTNWYRRQWEEAKAKYDASNGAQDLKDAMDQAWNAYQSKLNDQMALQLRISTDQANKTDVVAKAQEKYDTAVANLNAAQQGPDATRLAVAQAKVAVAEANLAEAQAHYARVKAGPDPDQWALAQARLTSAEAQLAAAKSALEDLELRAPFSGTVAELPIHAGEWVIPGQPALLLSDLQHLRVETTDLSERDVPKIEIGKPVTVLIKALNQDVTGRVSDISPLADTLGGDVVYKTTIDLDARPSGLRAGMSVEVQFGTGP